MEEPFPRRVLVADDEADVRESTCLLLERLGCEVIATDDPGDVLLLAMEHRPGLILQELKMPGINLAGIVAALRSEPSTAHIPLVFFSANADIAETARRYDAWGFLRKPFSPQALAQVVEQAFGEPATPEDPRRHLREVFHEQWNALSAIANYAHLMRMQAQGEGLGAVATKLEGQVLRLQASIDRLHTFVSYQPGPPELSTRQHEARDEAHSRRPRPRRMERPERL